MKIISWNVNGIRACVKKALPSFLEKEKPDIFCAQEVKSFKEQCEELWPGFSGLENDWNPAQRKGYSGVASFFKKSPKSIKEGIGDKKFDVEGRVQVMDLGDFYLINTYFPNGAASEDRHWFKMSFLDTAYEWLQDLDRKKPLILTGDINIAHREIDIHDPVRLDGTSGFKPEEREWMSKLLDAGFVDAYRHLYPEKKERYSWWSYRAGARQRNKGWRIDYFIVSDRLKDQIQEVKMLAQVSGSDHCPVVLELN